MKLQAYTFEKATLQLMSVLTQGMKQERYLSEMDKAFRTIANSYDGLNRRERSRLFTVAYNNARRAKAVARRGDGEWERYIASRTVYDAFVSTARTVDASFSARQKRIALGKAISDYESKYESEPIFYLCSYHSNCSCGHDTYQGKIYVDRFWRSKVSDDDYNKVQAYIRNRKVRTIQDVVKAPIWLTTRPYCRHYFTPVPTADVLTSSPKKLLHETNSYHYTPDYYDNDEYFHVRKEIYTHLNKLNPCDEFEIMIKKSARSRG